LPRELRDIIFLHLICLLDASAPSHRPPTLAYQPVTSVVGRTVLSQFSFTRQIYYDPKPLPYILDPAFAPESVREEILEVVAGRLWGISGVPLLTPGFGSLRALDTSVPASWFFGRYLSFKLPVRQMWEEWSSGSAVVPDTMAEDWIAHMTGLLRSVPARRTQSLAVEFKLKGLGYQEKVAFRKCMELMLSEIEGFREVKGWWKWGK